MPSELKSNWPQLGPTVTKAKDETLLAQGDVMKFRLIGRMHEPKTGRMYPRGRIGKLSPGDRPGSFSGPGWHQASAPGEPPATDYEKLERSISVENIDAITIGVGTDLDYAQVLEFGGGRIAPRPNFNPVGDEMADEVTEAIIQSTRTAIENNSLK